MYGHAALPLIDAQFWFSSKMINTVWTFRNGLPETVRLTEIFVPPPPLVVLVNVTVSEYVPGKRLLAFPLRETVTLVLAPPARVPLAGEIVSQLVVLVALQLTDPEPMFTRLYVLLDGLNGPPLLPLLEKPPAAGVT